MADYLTKRKGVVKPGTMQSDRQTEASLLAFFGADKRLKEITEGDAVDFRQFLLTKGGAPDQTLWTGNCGSATGTVGRSNHPQAMLDCRADVQLRHATWAH